MFGKGRIEGLECCCDYRVETLYYRKESLRNTVAIGGFFLVGVYFACIKDTAGTVKDRIFTET